MSRAVVIGAGLGGIAAAGRLARTGYEVTVLEKRLQPGGRCGRLAHDGHLFDTGPTLYLMPRIFEETFRDLGSRVEDHLDLVQVSPTYRVHFHDGSSLDLCGDLVAMERQLEAIEPGAFAGLLHFLAGGNAAYHTSLDSFVGRNFHSLLEYFSPANIPLMFRVKALTRHYSYVSRFFRDPRLRAAFSFQNMYLGLSPHDAMATYALLQYTEMAEGVWFPRGGMYRVIEALVSVAESLGVVFRMGAAAASIQVADGRATGVLTQDGEHIPADVVVANADLPYVYHELLPSDPAAARLARKRYTSSALMFYWGLTGGRDECLLHHNVFLADHAYRQSFDRIFRDHTLPDEPSFYVCAPSRTDPSQAPPDGDSLTVLVPVGRLDPARPADWAALRERAREAVFQGLARLGVCDLPSRIAFEHTCGPEDYRDDLNLFCGSAFSLSHNFLQVGYLRPHNVHARYGNLYFVGAGTHPGTGLPLVLLSARLVVERILGRGD